MGLPGNQKEQDDNEVLLQSLRNKTIKQNPPLRGDKVLSIVPKLSLRNPTT